MAATASVIGFLRPAGGGARGLKSAARGVLMVVGLLLAGCASVRHYEPDVDPNSLDGTTFIHYLGTVPVASVEEGCRAILLVADEDEDFGSHHDRYAELVGRGVIRASWRLEPGQVLDRGTLAFMAARVCRIPKGVNSLLLGSWGLGDRRYALKDVVAAGLMSYGMPGHAVRGGELVSVLTKMDEYLSEQDTRDQGQSEGRGVSIDVTNAADVKVAKQLLAMKVAN